MFSSLIRRGEYEGRGVQQGGPATIGRYYLQSDTTGIFADLRQQIFYLQKDLHSERHASAGRETVIVRLTEKVTKLEEELKQSKEEVSKLEQLVELSVSEEDKTEGKGEGKELGDPSPSGKENAPPPATPSGIQIGNPLEEFEKSSLMTKPKSGRTAPSSPNRAEPWVRLERDQTEMVPGENDEVWKWLGRTVVIDRGSAPPASQARRLKALRERRKLAEAKAAAIANAASPPPRQQLKGVHLDGGVKQGGSSWQHDMLLAHHKVNQRGPRKLRERVVVEECEFHEEREDPAASSEENTAAYRDDPMKSLFGVGLADEGGNPPNVEVDGAWTKHQSGGCQGGGSLANPQALVWFKESGVHRVKITLTVKKKLRKCGIVFFVYENNEGKRLYLGDPSDELEGRRPGKKYKSKACRKTHTSLILSLKGGKARGRQRQYMILPCLEVPGNTCDFSISVENTNRDAEPHLKMLSDLTHSATVEGEWKKRSAAPMHLFADKSDPTVNAPNIQSPQIECSVSKTTSVIVGVKCTERRTIKGAALFVFIYAENDDKPQNGDGRSRKRTFPKKDLVAEQEGYLDGDSLTITARLTEGRRYFIVPCILPEDQGDDDRGIDDSEWREGAFAVTFMSTAKMTTNLLPQFNPQKPKHSHQISCETVIENLRRSASTKPGAHGPGKYLLWDSRTLSADPLPEIEAMCAEDGESTKFIDADFAPDNASVNKDPSDVQLPSCQWARLSDICDSPSLFKDGLDPDDVIQGELGNCWFCAALAAISWMRPNTLKRSFSKVLSYKFTRGAFAVKIYDFRAEEDRWVVVDDYVPVDKDFMPYFARSRDPNECWPLLLEKVFAKLHSCYQLMAGHCKQCLKIGPVIRCLTKASVKKVITGEEDPDDLWKRIKKTVGHRGVLECSTRKSREAFKLGLVCFHAYTIVGVEDVKGHQLLRIRNTWGHSEWKGDWCDTDEANWTDEMKRAVSSYVDADDGAFYIAYRDFLTHYDKLYLGELPDEEEREDDDDGAATSCRDMVKGYWSCPYAGGHSADNPQYLVRFEGKKMKEVELELVIPEALYAEDHKQSYGQHELNLLVCMAPRNGKRLTDLDDMVIQQSRPKSSRKSSLSLQLPGGVRECIVIPCWADKRQDGNTETDEGSFKLSIESDTAFELSALAGGAGKRGSGRRRVEGKSINQTIVPNGLLGNFGQALHDGAKKVAEAACPVQ